jgi:hypothetical protein
MRARDEGATQANGKGKTNEHAYIVSGMIPWYLAAADPRYLPNPVGMNPSGRKTRGIETEVPRFRGACPYFKFVRL